MPNEISWDSVPGWTLKGYRFLANGNVLLSNGASNEVWGTGGRGADDYDVPVPEIGVGLSGHYVGDFDPDDAIATGRYRVVIARMRGANPADSDLPGMAKGPINWNGVLHEEIFCMDTTELAAAMKAITGITVGGTWTWEKIIKITTAWIAGNWRLKSTDANVQELLDAEDGTTVILEQSLTRAPGAGLDYRSITVKI